MAHPFYLRLPYVAKLENQIEPGQSLIVRGQATGERFVINMACGPEIEGSDIVFHASCRVKEKTFVMNTMTNGTWGKEERHKCAVDKSSPFSIRIRCHENKFEFFADGKHIADYSYRSALAAITHVQVYGELTLSAVGWEGNYYCVPYKIDIPGNFVPQRKLFLTLIPDDEKIEVNFMAGEEDIALHFNPRFNKKQTVNNSFFGGQWGKEEILTKFPFCRKKGFDLLFVCENEQFGVYVDGEPYCTFEHRIDPNKITGLWIKGCMELQVVNFE